MLRRLAHSTAALTYSFGAISQSNLGPSRSSRSIPIPISHRIQKLPTATTTTRHLQQLRTMSTSAEESTVMSATDEVKTTVATAAAAPVPPPAPITPRLAPPGFILHTEQTTSILFASPTPAPNTLLTTPQVFLNPVQEYNRDLSVACIRTWSVIRQKEKEEYWGIGLRRKWARQAGKRAKEVEVEGGAGEAEGGGKRRKFEEVKMEVVEGESTLPDPPVASTSTSIPNGGTATKDRPLLGPDRPLPTPPLFKFKLLEALSATGLRAIRYAKEIPLLGQVTANDLSSSAVEDIKRNIEWNGLSPEGLPEGYNESENKLHLSKLDMDVLRDGKIKVNEGDACTLMYNHRTESTRFDCVDLDPYGSATPFLDAAIGAISDGGLLCVTCTDMGVLAGHNYPEKAFTYYGGVCINAEYSHEAGLRLVLNMIAMTAARYGRYIEPLLSLSIDFYCRLFVRINTGPKEVKSLPSKTAIVYYCHDCQAHFMQPMGRTQEKVSQKTGDVNHTYHVPGGPPMGVGETCGECGGKFHIGGPMWAGPIHNKEFVGKVLELVRDEKNKFGTAQRIQGMLSVAKSELETPFYFTPSKICGIMHATCPPLTTVASAIVNAGYSVSRSHAVGGSIKTDAPRGLIYDIFREWCKENPVKMSNVKEKSPAKRMWEKEQKHTIDFTHNHKIEEALLQNIKLVRYQENPQANWGPAKAAFKTGKKKDVAETVVPVESVAKI